MRRTIGALFAGLLWVTASLSGGASRNDFARFEIDDSSSGAALLSDGNGPYADYRLSGGDKCVTAWVAPDGFFFTYLFRGSGQADDCYQVYPLAVVRTFLLKFPPASGACAELGLTPSDGICTLIVDSTSEHPRIRADRVFGNNVQATSVAFLFKRGASYEVRLDKDVPIVASDPTRTLSNDSGTATLWKLGGKRGPVPVGTPFVFPFTLSVTRVAQ